MENNQIILNDKRKCSKLCLLLNSIFLLYNIISIFIDLEFIEKNKLFYHYIITLISMFISSFNHTYREYIYITKIMVEYLFLWKNINFGKKKIKVILNIY